MKVIYDHDVEGFGRGDSDALRRVADYVRLIVQFELSHGVPEIDTDDILAAALADIVSGLASGACKTGSELERLSKRAVWKHSKRARRLRNREVDYEAAKYYYGVDDSNPERNLLLKEVLSNLEQVEEVYHQEKTQPEEHEAKSDLIILDDQLIKYLKNHPKALYQLTPRRFEELVADILRDLGYIVELTQNSADGGIDIFATQKTGVGELLLVVDCKLYSPAHKVGVGMIRSLFAAGERHKATISMLATSSFFTEPAREFQSFFKYRLSLKDFDDICALLKAYGTDRKKMLL